MKPVVLTSAKVIYLYYDPKSKRLTGSAALVKLRTKAGLSQQQAATLTGLSARAIVNLETGRNVRASTLVRFVKGLDESMSVELN